MELGTTMELGHWTYSRSSRCVRDVPLHGRTEPLAAKGSQEQVDTTREAHSSLLAPFAGVCLSSGGTAVLLLGCASCRAEQRGADRAALRGQVEVVALLVVVEHLLPQAGRVHPGDEILDGAGHEERGVRHHLGPHTDVSLLHEGDGVAQVLRHAQLHQQPGQAPAAEGGGRDVLADGQRLPAVHQPQPVQLLQQRGGAAGAEGGAGRAQVAEPPGQGAHGAGQRLVLRVVLPPAHPVPPQRPHLRQVPPRRLPVHQVQPPQQLLLVVFQFPHHLCGTALRRLRRLPGTFPGRSGRCPAAFPGRSRRDTEPGVPPRECFPGSRAKDGPESPSPRRRRQIEPSPGCGCFPPRCAHRRGQPGAEGSPQVRPQRPDTRSGTGSPTSSRQGPSLGFVVPLGKMAEALCFSVTSLSS